jgi:hypothetical protein
MGIIRLEFKGSFSQMCAEEFSAEYGGHVDAVGRAIQFLTEDVLPEAIKKDHRLAAQGEKPPRCDFGCSQELLAAMENDE